MTPHEKDVPPVQFSLRWMLLGLTTASGVFGLVAWLMPVSWPLAPRLAAFAGIGMFFAGLAVAVWVAKRNAYRPPTEYVLVKVDAKWKRRVTTRYIFLPIASLTGVSITFAPLALLWCGDYRQWGITQWIMAPTCLAVIYFVPLFYMRLAGEVIRELTQDGGE